ncbi:MAG: hydrolase [Candidatus Obscuribacterales bacterium]|nr:hydrolase [Candidatus Obscuribacterales bacterium]
MKRHERLLDGQQAVLLIVDVQEAFRKKLPDVPNLTRNISILVEASKVLELPIFVTEQYPQGLGKTVPEIAACLPDHELFDKLCFSCCGLDKFMDALKATKRKQVILCGIEAHACINQTAHDLLANGYEVHLIVDAISSRFPKNRDIAVEKMVASGVVRSCVEMALLEMLVEAGTEKFKSVQRLIH